MDINNIKYTHQEQARVFWNIKENASYRRIALACRPDYRFAQAGQFVTLRIPNQLSPLLRRPFSIHRLIEHKGNILGIEILYKIVGKFTLTLSRAKEGDPVDLLGPLGHGFTISNQVHKIAFLAGGIGVAPLVFLAESYAAAGMDFTDSVACIGGKSVNDILCKHMFASLNMNVWTATEDGSEGEKGVVIAPFSKWLEKNRPDMIYACGPMPMLKTVIALARLEKIPCEVSVETIMACGVGACLGCAIQTNHDLDTYGHACVDGPVFDAQELIT